MRRAHVAVLSTLLVPCTMKAIAGGNLLLNPGLEDIPGPIQGQGVLPSSWLVINSSPDTYSNDGSYGLAPDAFNNFNGVVAHGGIRWMAGWSVALEVPGQLLTRPLVPGASYRIAAYLHQAQRPDLAHPGAYEIRLAETANLTSTVSLGMWAPTEFDDQWEYRSLEFVAPPEASTHHYLILVPYGADSASAYPGVDDIELVADEASCPADLTGDGVVDAADLAVLLGSWNQPGPADFDASGAVNAADLTVLLAAWGPC